MFYRLPKATEMRRKWIAVQELEPKSLNCHFVSAVLGFGVKCRAYHNE